MQDYRSLAVWQKSHALTLAVYQLTKGLRGSETWSLADQLRRAAASVPTNVVEGRAKGSDLEFRRFLRIALGSASELEYLLLLAKDLGHLPADQFEQLCTACGDVKTMLFAFTKRLGPVKTKVST